MITQTDTHTHIHTATHTHSHIHTYRLSLQGSQTTVHNRARTQNLPPQGSAPLMGYTVMRDECRYVYFSLCVMVVCAKESLCPGGKVCGGDEEGE